MFQLVLQNTRQAVGGVKKIAGRGWIRRQNTCLGVWYQNVSHQCCLLDSSHCFRPDSRNALRARTPFARLAGILRCPPGRHSAFGCLGRGTASEPGPEAPSPARPAGTAPRDALECYWRKCRWTCCNICSETKGDGRRSGTHSLRCAAECSNTDNSQWFFLSADICGFSTRHKKPL